MCKLGKRETHSDIWHSVHFSNVYILLMHSVHTMLLTTVITLPLM